jgi:hypothetical protein
MVDTSLRKGVLSTFWLKSLVERAEKHFTDVTARGTLVDHWKQDGWNDGTTTLFGVWNCDGTYYLCAFPDYDTPTKHVVQPRIEHVGWHADA